MSSVWDDRGSGAIQNVSCWQVIPESTGINGSEFIPVSANVFRAEGQVNVKPPQAVALIPLLEVKNQFKNYIVRPPIVTPFTIPSVGGIILGTLYQQRNSAE